VINYYLKLGKVIKGKKLDNNYYIGTNFVYESEQEPEKHKQLYHGNYLIMDTWGDNWFLKLPYDNASGSVLLSGLGLGVLPNLLLTKTEVTEILIVEKEKSIIDYIKQYIDSDKVNYIWMDIRDYHPDKEFDYCFIDIWCDENRKERESDEKILLENLSSYCKRIDFCQTLEEAKKYCGEE